MSSSTLHHLMIDETFKTSITFRRCLGERVLVPQLFTIWGKRIAANCTWALGHLTLALKTLASKCLSSARSSSISLLVAKRGWTDFAQTGRSNQTPSSSNSTLTKPQRKTHPKTGISRSEQWHFLSKDLIASSHVSTLRKPHKNLPAISYR